MANKYYYFHSKGCANTIAVSPDLFEKALAENDESPEGPREIINMLVFNNYPSWLQFPVSFTVFDGNKFKDVMEMRWVSAFLISEKVCKLLKDNGVTGWNPYDVIVKDKKGNVIPGYYGFTVTEKTPASNDASIPDFFNPVPKCGIVCSQKVVDLMKTNKIKDFEFDLIGVEGNFSFLYDYIKHLI